MDVKFSIPGVDISHLVITLSGKLETNEISTERAPSHVGHVTFDLKDWKTMNSIGIRTFMTWMRQFSEKKTVFRNCPKFFVDQINMVNGLIPPDAIIESFFVPYFNEKSSETISVLYRRGTEYWREGGDFMITHPRVFDSEGNPCDIDVPEFKFFSFLRRHS